MQGGKHGVNLIFGTGFHPTAANTNTVIDKPHFVFFVGKRNIRTFGFYGNVRIDDVIAVRFSRKMTVTENLIVALKFVHIEIQVSDIGVFQSGEFLLHLL